MAINGETTCKDFAWEERGDGRGEAHGFIDAGAEVAKRGEFGAIYYFFNGRKAASY